MNKMFPIILMSLIFNTYSEWQIIKNVPTQNDLTCVTFIGNDTGFIAGDSGILLRSIDGGDSWSLLQNNEKVNFKDIDFVNSKTGYVGGDGGVLLKTNDGGNNWKKLNLPLELKILQVQFTTNHPETGYIIGEDSSLRHHLRLFKTIDSGDTWNQISYFDSINASYVQLSFLTPDTGYVSCVYSQTFHIHRTTDGGVSWKDVFKHSEIYYFQFANLTVISPSVLYHVFSGNKGTGSDCSAFYSTDTGTNWNYRSTSIYPKISSKSIASLTWNFLKIEFLTNDSGYAIAHLGLLSDSLIRAIMKTENGGISWVLEKYDTTTNINRFNSISMKNLSSGIVVGDSGIILKRNDVKLDFKKTSKIDNSLLKIQKSSSSSVVY